MSRIFTTLASTAILMMAATLLLGLYIGDLHGHVDEQTKTLARIHFLSGVATALVIVLVNSIVVTYFIGTSRWCKEVVETYSLDGELLRRSVALKRRTFPWALLSMLAIVGLIALGGAADPATGRANTADWVVPHLIGAFAGLAFILWSFAIEALRIREHHVVISHILAEVHRIRTERGLEV